MTPSPSWKDPLPPRSIFVSLEGRLVPACLLLQQTLPQQASERQMAQLAVLQNSGCLKRRRQATLEAAYSHRWLLLVLWTTQAHPSKSKGAIAA